MMHAVALVPVRTLTKDREMRNERVEGVAQHANDTQNNPPFRKLTFLDKDKVVKTLVSRKCFNNAPSYPDC